MPAPATAQKPRPDGAPVGAARPGQSATAAVALGTLAAYVLVRFGRFRTRALLTGMSTAPLVMPEVITGLSLLLFFVAIGLGMPAIGCEFLTVLLAGRGRR